MSQTDEERELTSDTRILDPEDWVDAYGDKMFKYARARLRDIEAAEEVVQEALMSGFRRQESFSGRGTQIGWLMTILKNKVLDRVRRRDKILEQSWGGEHDPTALLFDEKGNWRPSALPRIEPGEKLEASELWSVVKECLGALPGHLADVFVLNVIEGKAAEEICKELEISTSNLWVRMHRARLGLAKCVGSKWYDQDMDEKLTNSRAKGAR